MTANDSKRMMKAMKQESERRERNKRIELI
jgi:hypothetical protein